MVLPEKLIILDYSGTLSRDAVLFAQPEYLMKHLKASGLKDMGIDNPEKYWEHLVNPSWVDGSTTSLGYKKVLETSLRTSMIQNSISIKGIEETTEVAQRHIADAVSLFVDSYLKNSCIDKRWEPILYKLQQFQSIRTIIATDHYAEATGLIIHCLEEFQIPAIPAREEDKFSQATSFIVANSADLGVHKADRRFWEILKSNPKMQNIRNILLIDDFGYHEQKGDRYGDFSNVKNRKENTVAILKWLFPADIEVFSFMTSDGQLTNDEIYGNLVMNVAARIESFLTFRE